MNVPLHVLYALYGIYTLLVFASLVVWVKNLRNPEKDYRELNLRTKSWWIIVILFSFAIIGNRVVAFVFIGLLSFLALKEYISLIPTRRSDHRVLFLTYLAIPIQLYIIHIGWLNMFYLFVPLYMFLVIPFRMITIGETEGFLKAAGTIQWGLMATVFSIGHLAAILVLPAIEKNPQAGNVGILLYLITLTSLNDVGQYVWGKTFGKHKIVPTVSPNKTWEGFLGGFATTTALAYVLAHYLTPHTPMQGAISGMLIALGGFVGDVVISALKRDLGIKDSGNVIPGHGGILDRLDSLIYTAPIFFHYTNYLHF